MELLLLQLRQMDCPFSRWWFFTGNKKVTEFLQLFFGGGKKKRILKPLLRLRGFRGVCIRTNTDFFYRHIGNRINAEKSPIKEKNGASSKWIPQIGRRTRHKGNLYFSHPYSLMSLFGHFQSRKRRLLTFGTHFSQRRGGGGTIRTCSKSEQQFERRRRRLVFPRKKKHLWLFVSRRATSKHPVFPAK